MQFGKLAKKYMLIASAALLTLTACGDANQYKPADYNDQPIPGVSSNDNPNPGPTVLPGLMAIGERYVRDDGKMESYLTGEWIDADIAQRRPMAVMIPNNRNALPLLNREVHILEDPQRASRTGAWERFAKAPYLNKAHGSTSRLRRLMSDSMNRPCTMYAMTR